MKNCDKRLKTIAIILASGSGVRFGGELPKQFAKLAGKSVLEHTIDAFERCDAIDEVIIVIAPKFRHLGEEILLKNDYKKITKLLNGGASRQESSQIGILSIAEREAKVLIHDSVRPFVSERILRECAAALDTHAAVDVAIECSDTIIQVRENIISQIPPRANLRRGQTPQAFKLSLIKKAHALAKNANLNGEKSVEFTDDCGIVRHFNLADIFVVSGEEENIKITHKSDIFTAEKLFSLKTQTIAENDFDFAALRGRVLVVFGGNSGIGREICDIATQNGAKTFAFSRKNGVNVSDFVAVKQTLNEILQKCGKVDFIINCAGVLKIGKLATRDFSDIKSEIETNFLGAINVAKAACEIDNGANVPSPKILLFTSSSYTRGRALYATYSAAKAGVVNLVQALAAEGVQINAINPERTATPMRFNAFGKEAVGSLLTAQKVAQTSLAVLLSDLNGEVVDVKVQR